MKGGIHHLRSDDFRNEAGWICIGGRPVTEIVREAGRTPLYIYDAQRIRQRIEHLRRHLPPVVKIHYAMKANPHPAVVDLVSRMVDGIDVASAGELDVALRTNTQPLDISFAGPGKRPAELLRAIQSGIVINVESETELKRIHELSSSVDRMPNVAIRVNPDFELKGSGMRMSGGPKPFGIDADRVPDVLRSIDSNWCVFHGFHIFSGSQNLNAAAICDSQSKAFDLAMQLSRHAPTPPKFINLGGGFGIPYFPGELPLDIAPIGTHLEKLAATLLETYADCDLVIELGRYIVGEAGIYVCEVIDRKVSRGQVFLIADGGLHHHLAVSGNFGQVIRRNYPVAFVQPPSGADLEEVTIVGPLCTPLDIIADKMTLPRAEIGDLVVVFQSGAYGFTASPRGFLSHPEPLELLI
jgi:diaminopimelate decarboxylase